MGTFRPAPLLLTMIFLLVGSFVANALFSFLEITISGWTGTCLIALIQIMLLALVGIMAKFDVWSIIVAVFMVVVGGVIGGMIAEYLGFVDFSQTIIIVLTQSTLLMATGAITNRGIQIFRYQQKSL